MCPHVGNIRSLGMLLLLMICKINHLMLPFLLFEAQKHKGSYNTKDVAPNKGNGFKAYFLERPIAYGDI
ncbi:hypothetical protein Tco_1519394, partial [Tanacetum coccineum]